LYSILEERFQTSTSINQVPAMKPGSSKSYFRCVFSWSCLYCTSSYCIGIELYIWWPSPKNLY
jgi:hypothetical protein